MSSSKARPILAAVVALCAACSNDSPTDPPSTAGDPGLVRFSYSGSGVGGTFAAQGNLDTDPMADPLAKTFAVALDFSGSGGGAPFYEIVAMNVGSPKLDIMSILLSGQKTGAYPVMTEDDCAGPSLQATCALAWFYLGFNPDDTLPPREFVLTSGTVQVTSVSNGRLKGTFQGSAREVADGGGSVGPFVDGIAVEVVSGTFDVPVVGNQGWILLPDLLPMGGVSLLRGGGRASLSAWGGGRR